jgi:hypothetical protein
MPLDAAAIYDQALLLSEEDRGVLALRLIESMVPTDKVEEDDFDYTDLAGAMTLFEAGLLLPDEERAMLAARLIKGVDGGTNENLNDTGWDEIVERRVAEIDERRVTLITLGRIAVLLERPVVEGEVMVRFHPACIDELSAGIAFYTSDESQAEREELEAIAASELGQAIHAREAVFPTGIRLANGFRDSIASSLQLMIEDPDSWAAFVCGTKRIGDQFLAVIFRARPGTIEVISLALA